MSTKSTQQNVSSEPSTKKLKVQDEHVSNTNPKSTETKLTVEETVLSEAISLLWNEDDDLVDHKVVIRCNNDMIYGGIITLTESRDYAPKPNVSPESQMHKQLCDVYSCSFKCEWRLNLFEQSDEIHDILTGNYCSKVFHNNKLVMCDDHQKYHTSFTLTTKNVSDIHDKGLVAFVSLFKPQQDAVVHFTGCHYDNVSTLFPCSVNHPKWKF